MKQRIGSQMFDVVTPDYKLTRLSGELIKSMAMPYKSAKSVVRFYWKKNIHFTIILRDSIGWRIEGSFRYYRTQRDAVYALVKAKGKEDKIR